MSSSITDLLVTAAVASAPGLFFGLWAWFKAHAAQTPAKWDDNVVSAVQTIAQGVVDKSKS